MKKNYFRRFALMAVVLGGLVVAGGFGLMVIAHAQSVPLPSGDLTISPDILPDGTVGIPYSQTLTASTTASGTFTWTISGGSLPSGLSLSSSTNATGSTANASGTTVTIWGTPTMAGQGLTFSVSSTNNSIAYTQTYVMNIDANTSSGTVMTSLPTSTGITTTTTSTPIVVTSTVSTTITTSNTAAEIAALTQEVLQLESEVPNTSQNTTATGYVSCGSATFCRDLTVGDIGSDVLALQQFLNNNGATVAATGPGSLGNETDYFGPLTQAALVQWQSRNSISPDVGYFGPITRAAVIAKMSANGDASSTGNSSAPMIPYNPSPTQ